MKTVKSILRVPRRSGSKNPYIDGAAKFLFFVKSLSSTTTTLVLVVRDSITAANVMIGYNYSVSCLKISN